MIMNEKEALYIACEMEKRAIEMYQRALLLFTKEEVKKVIEELIVDEKEHLTQFKDFREEFGSHDIDFEKTILLKAYAGEFVFKGGLSQAQREKAFESGQHLLKFAIREEEKAFEKYKEFALICKNEKAKEAFLSIAEEEKMHKVQLEKQLEA